MLSWKPIACLLDPWHKAPWLGILQIVGFPLACLWFFDLDTNPHDTAMSGPYGLLLLVLWGVSIAWTGRLLFYTLFCALEALEELGPSLARALNRRTWTRNAFTWSKVLFYWVTSFALNWLGGGLIASTLRGAGFALAKISGHDTIGNTTYINETAAYGPIFSVLLVVLGFAPILATFCMAVDVEKAIDHKGLRTLTCSFLATSCLAGLIFGCLSQFQN